MLTFLLSSTSKLKTVHLQGFCSKTVYLKKTVHLQGFWPKTVYLKCFEFQLKTVYLQGPCSSRPCISRPCCTHLLINSQKIVLQRFARLKKNFSLQIYKQKSINFQFIKTFTLTLHNYSGFLCLQLGKNEHNL